jgi:hypothetical protein
MYTVSPKEMARLFGVLPRDPAYLAGLNRFELFPRKIMFVERRVINSPKESTPNAANIPIKILARLRNNFFRRSSIIIVLAQLSIRHREPRHITK